MEKPWFSRKPKSKLPPRQNFGLPPPPDLHNPRYQLYLIILIAAIIFILLLGAGAYVTSQPNFCRLCHEMEPQVKSWEKSLHAKVTCYACHIRPGPASFLQAKAQLAVMVYKHVTGLYEKPINKGNKLSKKIPTENCEQCHVPKRLPTPRAGLLIDHKIHKKNKILCTTCHNRIAHTNLKGYTNYLTMRGCFRCHGHTKTAKAPGECKKCHSQRFDLFPASHKIATWWAPDHGKFAKKDRAFCKMCHVSTFCRNCHGLDMPHQRATWVFGKKEHTKVGSQKPELCAKCHGKEPNFCDSCHHKGYDTVTGPWLQLHPTRARKAGITSCFDCHGPVYCSYCHTRGVKPKSIKGP